MTNLKDAKTSESTNSYDKEAEASNWFGPEIVFGLSYKFVKANEKVLDIGIGTGLCSELFHKAGLHIYGMDISSKMLEFSRKKMPDIHFSKHDLLVEPYPYPSKSMDHAVCVGVMNFFEDLTVIFREVSRIISSSGIFGFVVGHRKENEESRFLVGKEHTHSDRTITMYKHDQIQINRLSDLYGFIIRRTLEFPIYMDRERNRKFAAKAYIVRKK